MAVAALSGASNFCHRHRMGLWRCGGKPAAVFGNNAMVLGKARRAAITLSGALDLFARTGAGVSLCLSLALDTSGRLDWAQRHFADGPVHVRDEGAVP